MRSKVFMLSALFVHTAQPDARIFVNNDMMISACADLHQVRPHFETKNFILVLIKFTY